jgi:hypothetical protein
MISAMIRSYELALVALLAAGLVLCTSHAMAFDGEPESQHASYESEQGTSGSGAHGPYVLAASPDKVDLESHGGYSSAYIFGMTKGVMRSTLVPALKPVVLILTIPLDIVLLPFTAIGGFFR